MSWTVRSGPDATERALACCRGAYQRAIVLGQEALSGSTLRGKASRYIGRYRASSRSLILRMHAAGLNVWEERGPHGKRILHIESDNRLVELAKEAQALLEKRVA